MKNFNFSWELKKEVFEIDHMLKDFLNSWREDIYEFNHDLENDYLYRSICEFVLLAYKYFGIDKDLSKKMVVIFKMVYLANYIHSKVRDDEEEQEYNQELQYTILTGDYLFGHIMKLLIEANGGEVVDSFAHMMAEINEGFIIQHKIDPISIEVIEKTIASYYGTAFLTAARFAGIQKETELFIIRDLGLNLGIAMYLIYTDAAYGKINPYIIRVNKLFSLINLHKRIANSSLEKAVEEISEFSGNLKAAVI